jgi:hypothetical protein
MTPKGAHGVIDLLVVTSIHPGNGRPRRRRTAALPHFRGLVWRGAVAVEYGYSGNGRLIVLGVGDVKRAFHIARTVERRHADTTRSRRNLTNDRWLAQLCRPGYDDD